MEIIKPEHAGKILYPHPIILITSGLQHKYNVATISWYSVVSHTPSLIGFSITPSAYSFGLIRNSGEFNIHIPTWEIMHKVHFCGTTTGADVYKITESNILTIPSRMTRGVWLTECVAHIECSLVGYYPFGDRMWIVGEVILAAVEKEGFTIEDGWHEDVQLLTHYGGFRYGCQGKVYETKDRRTITPAFLDTRSTEEMKPLRGNYMPPLFPPKE